MNQLYTVYTYIYIYYIINHLQGSPASRLALRFSVGARHWELRYSWGLECCEDSRKKQLSIVYGTVYIYFKQYDFMYNVQSIWYIVYKYYQYYITYYLNLLATYYSFYHMIVSYISLIWVLILYIVLCYIIIFNIVSYIIYYTSCSILYWNAILYILGLLSICIVYAVTPTTTASLYTLLRFADSSLHLQWRTSAEHVVKIETLQAEKRALWNLMGLEIDEGIGNKTYY